MQGTEQHLAERSHWAKDSEVTAYLAKGEIGNGHPSKKHLLLSKQFILDRK